MAILITTIVASLIFMWRNVLDIQRYIFVWLSTVKPVFKGQLWNKEKVDLCDRWPLKRGSIRMKCSATGNEKGDLLIQATAWAGLTMSLAYDRFVTLSRHWYILSIDFLHI